MDAEKIKQIIKKLESALPQEDAKNEHCEIDTETIMDILKVFKDLPGQVKRLDAFEEQERQLRDLIWATRESEDKDKAYRELAQKLGCAVDKRKIEDHWLLTAYLMKIGAFRGYKPWPCVMTKDEAIQQLSKIYKIQSQGATIQRLQRARKKMIDSLKARKKDFSWLIGTLPSKGHKE